MDKKKGRGVPCKGSQRPLPTKEVVCVARGLCLEKECARRMRGREAMGRRRREQGWRKGGKR